MRRAILSLAVLSALAGSTAHAQIDRGPYLHQGTPDSTIVVYRTSSAADGGVCYGASPDALTQRATGPRGTQHEIYISGLTADTRYYYAADTGSCPPGSAGNADHWFRTAPAVGAATPFRFWVVGDSGTGGSRQAAVRDAMLGTGMRPDIFIHVGDMAYGSGTTSEFDDNFYGMYPTILQNTVIWPAMGNHEGRTSTSATQSGPYYEGYALPADGEAGGLPSMTEAYYSFDYANAHFIVLDSHQSDRDPGAAMLRWMQMDLASTDQDWLIAYWHHPAYTKGSHDSDREGALVDMRENALPILEAAGVDLVLAGHSHIYERSYLMNGAYDTPTTAAGYVLDMGDGQIGGDGAYVKSATGAVYVVAGHGGTGVSGPADHPIMFFSEVANGSCLVDVSATTLTLRNIRHDGVETDSVTIVKGDGIFLIEPIGGEVYLAGATVDIAWSSTGPVGNVRIEYTLDGGRSWMEEIASTENDGMYQWTAPPYRTTEARVRLTDLDDPANQAESGNFELSAIAILDLIPQGSVWEYHDQDVDPGATWLAEYGGWMSGPGQLGYGEGDEATMLYDADPNVPTAYFRHEVDLSAMPIDAELQVLFDDGYMVWINGTQVASANIGDPSHAEYATGSSADNELATTTLDLAADNPFVIGRNIISAIVKQSSGGSSDLSFDLELTVTVMTDATPPPGADGGPPLPDGAIPPGTDGGPVGGGDGSVDGGGDDDGGCCRVAGAGASTRGAPIALLLVVLLVVARRRFRA